jgi:hypothetical protein
MAEREKERERERERERKGERERERERLSIAAVSQGYFLYFIIPFSQKKGLEKYRKVRKTKNENIIGD